MPMPVRLDFFGDTLESIRSFDPETQRTTGQLRALDLVPVTEVQLTTETIRRFRQGYVAAFGAADARRHALRGGQRGPPLSRHGALAAAVPRRGSTRCSTTCPARRSPLEPLAEDAARERLAQIADYYDARTPGARDGRRAAPPYKPLPPDRLYLAESEWRERLDARRARAR